MMIHAAAGLQQVALGGAGVAGTAPEVPAVGLMHPVVCSTLWMRPLRWQCGRGRQVQIIQGAEALMCACRGLRPRAASAFALSCWRQNIQDTLAQSLCLLGKIDKGI